MRPKSVSTSRFLRRLADGLETVEEIAEDLQISHAMASAMMERLIREGIVERESSPTFYPFESPTPLYRHRLRDRELVAA